MSGHHPHRGAGSHKGQHPASPAAAVQQQRKVQWQRKNNGGLWQQHHRFPQHTPQHVVDREGAQDQTHLQTALGKCPGTGMPEVTTTQRGEEEDGH